ncbi:MAG: NUDIX domain-containing protein [Candidatus Pacearchaeota archaeon]
MLRRIKKYRKAIFIVVYKKINNKILYLLLKRKMHWIGWEFPKGGIEFFETRRKTVKREVKEETGLKAIKIINHKKKGKYEYSKNIPDRPYIGQTYSLYSAEVHDKKIKIDNKEHSEYKWLPFKQAYKKLTWKNQKECLKIVNEYLKKIK